jgi:hypothetical protein
VIIQDQKTIQQTRFLMVLGCLSFASAVKASRTLALGAAGECPVTFERATNIDNETTRKAEITQQSLAIDVRRPSHAYYQNKARCDLHTPKYHQDGFSSVNTQFIKGN